MFFHLCTHQKCDNAEAGIIYVQTGVHGARSVSARSPFQAQTSRSMHPNHSRHLHMRMIPAFYEEEIPVFELLARLQECYMHTNCRSTTHCTLQRMFDLYMCSFLAFDFLCARSGLDMMQTKLKIVPSTELGKNS